VDFVVVGFGLGALSVLLGVVMLSRAAGQADRAAGRACLYAGAAVLLATVGALAGSLDDRTGAYFVTTTVTVAALGFLVWNFLQRARHGPPAPLRPESRARAVPPAARAEFPSFADAASWESDPHIEIELVSDAGVASPVRADRDERGCAEADEAAGGTVASAAEPTAETAGAEQGTDAEPASTADIAAEHDRAGDQRSLARSAARGSTGAGRNGGEPRSAEDEEKLS
jgi:hypothetical protein